jgi:holo-[acyl-carrier protein] synthase
LILGIGTDLVDMRRIERTLARFGARFCERVYTEAERARAERNIDPVAAYAKRYAAKEACAKALGTGFRQGVYWRDIEVVRRGTGMPVLERAAQSYVEDCQVCCRPWQVTVRLDNDGDADIELKTGDEL